MIVLNNLIIITMLKTDIIDYLGNKIETVKDLENYLFTLNKYYYNNEAKISDQEYDMLYNILKKEMPNSSVISQVGHIPDTKKVKLPIYMGSLDKIKPGKPSLTKFLDYKGSFVISEKLDGISMLVVFNKFTMEMLYTG